MSLKNLSAWTGIAQTAATRLGTSDPDIVRAILAQWTCEQSGTWPPTRNNPGNVARGWAAGLGYSFTVSSPNPQPSNPIVTFSDPRVGALCYADGIRKFSRYAKVMAAVRAGDGAAFLRAITDAHYGTGYNCSIGAYRSLGGHVPVGTQSPGGAAETPGSSSSPTSSSTSITMKVTKVQTGTAAAQCSDVTILWPGPAAGFWHIIPIPAADVADPCTQCAEGWTKAIVTNPLGFAGVASLLGLVDASRLPSNGWNACVPADTKPGDTIHVDPGAAVPDLTAGIATAITSAAQAIGGAAFDIGKRGLQATTLLVVIVVGLWLLVRG